MSTRKLGKTTRVALLAIAITGVAAAPGALERLPGRCGRAIRENCDEIMGQRLASYASTPLLLPLVRDNAGGCRTRREDDLSPLAHIASLLHTGKNDAARAAFDQYLPTRLVDEEPLPFECGDVYQDRTVLAVLAYTLGDLTLAENLAANPAPLVHGTWWMEYEVAKCAMIGAGNFDLAFFHTSFAVVMSPSEELLLERGLQHCASGNLPDAMYDLIRSALLRMRAGVGRIGLAPFLDEYFPVENGRCKVGEE